MHKDKSRILVVDDEPRYVWAIRVNLEARGYTVLTAANGQKAVELVAGKTPDLVILDVRMPHLDGLEACQRIRQFSTVPILMLTAAAEDTDKVKGLDAGADDYLTKPFSAEELLARVRAALRRSEFAASRDGGPIFESGGLRVDLARQQVFVDGDEVELTPTEYRLLREMVGSAGRVLVPDRLLERVWGLGCEGEYRLLRQVVHRLRQKIEPDPQNPRYILTRRGIGYLLALLP
jgi:DNA-binding response OmpR family regulator